MRRRGNDPGTRSKPAAAWRCVLLAAPPTTCTCLAVSSPVVQPPLQREYYQPASRPRRGAGARAALRCYYYAPPRPVSASSLGSCTGPVRGDSFAPAPWLLPHQTCYHPPARGGNSSGARRRRRAPAAAKIETSSRRLAAALRTRRQRAGRRSRGLVVHHASITSALLFCRKR